MPAGTVRLRFSDTEPPVVAVPDDSANDVVCPDNRLEESRSQRMTAGAALNAADRRMPDSDEEELVNNKQNCMLHQARLLVESC